MSYTAGGFDNVFEVKENFLEHMENAFNREVISLLEKGSLNKYK